MIRKSFYEQNVNRQERRNIVNYGLLSLLPPVVAVILAIWSKNVISCYCFLFKEERTLFYGICLFSLDVLLFRSSF